MHGVGIRQLVRRRPDAEIGITRHQWHGRGTQSCSRTVGPAPATIARHTRYPMTNLDLLILLLLCPNPTSASVISGVLAAHESTPIRPDNPVSPASRGGRDERESQDGSKPLAGSLIPPGLGGSQAVMKSNAGRHTWALNPGTCRRLLVKC